MKNNHFATFGGSQLEGFKVGNPMKVAVMKEGLTDDELRAELRKPPFNNEYCTTYPLERFEAMSKNYGVAMYDLDELRGYYES